MTRILRYLGNRETPEPSLYGPVDHVIPRRSMRGPIKYDVNNYAHIPDVMQSGIEKYGNLFIPVHWETGSWIDSAYMRYMTGLQRIPWAPYLSGSWIDDIAPSTPKVEPPFEVNMMEALVGWKAWSLEKGMLHSVSAAEVPWPVDEPLVAVCKHDTKCGEDVPREHHTCGIYASSSKDAAKGYVDDNYELYGLVYGWGRYVRGEDGWRSQFAYPKCFYLNADQVELIEPLKKYHVPIYVDQPTRIYDPSEDGYEHRSDEENWHCGADQGSTATEERDTGDEED